MKCFKCSKSMKNSGEKRDPLPNGGTVWSSRGNYGSTIFDPDVHPDQPAHLTLYICDGCLKTNIGKVIGRKDGKRASAKALIA